MKIININACKNLLILGMLLLTSNIIFGTELNVEPTEIHFDYVSSSHSNDALTVSDEDGIQITASEYNGSEVTKAAYIKGQSNRKIKVRFVANGYSGAAHLLINISYATGSGSGIGLLESYFACNVDVSATGDDFVELSLVGTLPDTIGIHEFEWEWKIFAIPINNSNYCASWNTYNTNHHYYTLLSAPIAPVQKPWLPVLDLACNWASGKNNEADILAEITINAYDHFGQTKQYWGGSSLALGTTFHLSQFLASSHVNADCQDMSAVVQVFTWMLGGTLTRVLYINNKQRYNEDFICEEIKPIGKTWETNNDWNFHQVGWLNNVYDACIKLEYGNEWIAVGEDVSEGEDYEQNLRKSGDWEPKTNNTFYYTVVD